MEFTRVLWAYHGDTCMNSLPYWVIFHAFLLSADFFQISFLEKPSKSHSLDPDQDKHYVGPDLGPSCLKRLSADDSSRQRANSF